MSTAYIGILLATGVVVGFASSLLGVGGGFIMGPVLYFLYTNMGLPVDLAIRLTFGTNLAAILPTALSGVWRHNRKGVVLWREAFIMGLTSMAAAFIGSSLATHLPGEALKIAFGAVILAAAVRMLFSNLPLTMEKRELKPWKYFVWAIPVGLLSGLLGVGGGVLAVPIMTLALGFTMINAVATSLAIVAMSSIGGITGYIVNGQGVSGLLPYSVGYINIPSWLLLSVPSIITAQVGAVTAHRLPAQQLKYIFVVLFVFMGLRMIGVFQMLGLPV